jgi:hypothetical protein
MASIRCGGGRDQDLLHVIFLLSVLEAENYLLLQKDGASDVSAEKDKKIRYDHQIMRELSVELIFLRELQTILLNAVLDLIEFCLNQTIAVDG